MLVQRTIFIILFALVSFTVAAADVSSPATGGPNLANNCFACHGPHGKSPGAIPSIANLTAAQIADALKQFKSGERPATIMDRLAKGYSDAQIETLANILGKKP